MITHGSSTVLPIAQRRAFRAPTAILRTTATSRLTIAGSSLWGRLVLANASARRRARQTPSPPIRPQFALVRGSLLALSIAEHAGWKLVHDRYNGKNQLSRSRVRDRR